MKAIITNKAGGVENLVQVEMPVPALLPNEVLVKVNAVSGRLPMAFRPEMRLTNSFIWTAKHICLAIF